jgi:aspartyl-tRNA(Asn)/glutamyl-tRNA(Gln) amidotransferase subunit B
VARELLGEGLDPEIRASFEAVSKWLVAEGASVVDVELPHARYAIATYYLIAPAEASSNLARYDGVRYGLRVPAGNLREMYEATRGCGFEREVKRRILLGTYALSAGYYDAYYLRAQKVRTLIRRDFEEASRKADALLMPVTPTPPFSLGEKSEDPMAMYLNDIYSIPASLAGVPALSFPAGFTRSGLPIGLQLTGSRSTRRRSFESRGPGAEGDAARRLPDRPGAGRVSATRAASVETAREAEPVIGLEVHAQLKTRTKISAAAPRASARRRTRRSPLCLGLPGVLPTLNARAVDFAAMSGWRSAPVAGRSVFARKNYFYPDLPKGYQISQYDRPLCVGGSLTIRSGDGWKTVRLVRIHLEEDAGKSLHPEGREGVETTRVDLNRAGVPLIEIVSEPELRSGAEATDYMARLRQLLVYLDVCDGNMEEGSLRCDANVSVRKKGATEPGQRRRSEPELLPLRRSRDRVRDRPPDRLSSPAAASSRRRSSESERGVAETMRSKEEARDYRYFPEPDLPSICRASGSRLSAGASLSPHQLRERLVREQKIPEYDAEVLTDTRSLAGYYEEVAARSGQPKLASNWIMTEVNAVRNKNGLTIEAFPIRPDRLGDMIRMVAEGKISGKIAKQLFELMLQSPASPAELIEQHGLLPIDDDAALRALAREIIAAHAGPAADFRAGKEKTFAFLVGQAMKQSRGRAHPEKLQLALRAVLAEER